MDLLQGQYGWKVIVPTIFTLIALSLQEEPAGLDWIGFFIAIRITYEI